MFDHPDYDGHEKVLMAEDAQSGLRAIIAVHSTALGFAAGGCRLWRYATSEAALSDALRLSRGMSYKNAMADLPLGGGKAVILGPVAPERRLAAFEAFGRMVDSLNGAYLQVDEARFDQSGIRTLYEAPDFPLQRNRPEAPAPVEEAESTPAPVTAAPRKKAAAAG